MDNLKNTGRLLFIAGIIEIIIGIMHFIMPYFVIQSKGFSELNPDETKFLIHSVIAVGIAIIPFGILTVIFSVMRKSLGKILLYYCIIKSVLWGGRVISELILPVKLTLFHFTNPTTLILPLCIIIWLLFLIPAVNLYIFNSRMTDK